MIPLYDLHVHFGGAIPIKTIWKMLLEDGHLSSYEDDVKRAMTYEDDNGPYEFSKFLKKFDILNMINWTEERIAIAADAIAESMASSVHYAEIRFSIDKYTPHLNMTNKEITVFIANQLILAGKKHNIIIVPILSIKYESDRSNQLSIASLIDSNDVSDCVFGIDLVGNEQYMDAKFYAPIFKQWRKAGKGLIAHAGESQGAENVRIAIEELSVDRVSHGIRAASSQDIMKLANDHNVSFDIALTSNLRTGVVQDLKSHPIIELIKHKCAITIGTDDPVILNTTLQNEFDIAHSEVGLSLDQLNEIKKTAISKAILR
jgi:adenosine deaminase